MSVLGSMTQSNPNSYFFALAGGGSASSLQSPATVVPDGAGNTTLALTAAPLTGAASLSVTGATALLPGGGPGSVIVGGYGVNYRAAVLDNSGILQVGLNSVANPVIQYDSQNTHQLLLGDKSSLSTASVQTNVPFVVRDYTTDPTVSNGIAMDVVSSTQTSIRNACVSGGFMSIGSSVNYPSVLELHDNSTQAYAYIGGNGGNKLYINPFSSNLTTIGTSAVEYTNGNLQLQASQAATNTVNITDTNMTVDQILTLAQPPVLTTGAATILAPGTHGGGVNATINVSTYADGLWLFITKPSVTSDQTTYNAMVSGTIYINGGKITGGGYIGVAGTSAASIQTQVVVPGNTFNVINSTGNNIYYGAYLQQLTGPFPGL